MDKKTYNSILGLIYKTSGNAYVRLKKLKENFPNVPHDTLQTILSMEYQKWMRNNHTKSKATIDKYWDMYNNAIRKGESPGIILRIANEVEVCPCLVAKLILQRYFEDKQIPEKNVNPYLRDTSLIPDMDLAYETFLCTIYDTVYGPYSDTINNSVGQQYEIKLYNEIVKLGLVFRNEENLRKDGYDKTPDIKLDIPIAIDGFIVNWIESKAIFGGEDVHKDYVRNQYLSYWNRFGSGLVIYWFGFVETIVDPTDKRFIIRDHLPTNIVHINADTS